MKKISQEQINKILDVLMQLNIPVKTYVSMQDMFEKLPLVEEIKEKK